MEKFSVELTKDQWSLVNLALTKTFGVTCQSASRILETIAKAKIKAAAQEETKELMFHIDVDEELKESIAKEFAKCFRISIC